MPENNMLDLYEHQIDGCKILTKWNDPATGRVLGGCFGLFDEMGLGKSRQVIETAQTLFQAKEIQSVIIAAPASVRAVWYDPELGELAKFYSDPIRVIEYHTKLREWHRWEGSSPYLTWYITNYDFIRNPERLKPLLEIAKEGKTLLVLDESSAVKNWKAAQSKASLILRNECARVILLNGTPIAHSPGDLFMQAFIMDPSILGCQTYYQFRARYAVMGGWRGKQIVGWLHPARGEPKGVRQKVECCDLPFPSPVHCAPGQGLDDIQQRLKPYVLRREKKDCLDLPPKLPPVVITVPLTEQTWTVYKEMRDEMIAWLDEQTAVSAPQAGVRILRLAQVTSGFLGGVKTEIDCECGSSNPSCVICGGLGKAIKEEPPRDLSREKHDALLTLLNEKFENGEKVLVWCRFRYEVERIIEDVTEVPLEVIWGGQNLRERQDALRLLDPRTAPEGPAVLVGTPASGSVGLNLTAAWNVAYISNDYSLKTRIQSMARVHRYGQTHPVNYYDFIATGPEGQRTSDHAIIKSLYAKESLANWTVSAWKDELLKI